jgi:hypothetical protein
MADYLDEDVVISSQKYCIISYVIPPQEDVKGKKPAGFNTPMIKVRATASTLEECEARIKRLQQTDKYFHIYVLETGKWSALLTEDQLKQKDLEVVYRDEEIQTFMKGYKEQKDKADMHYQERKEMMKQQATLDGTKEGQQKLAEVKENPLSVKNRMDESLKVINKLQKDLYEFEEMHRDAKNKLETYSQQEMDDALADFEKLRIEQKQA